MPILAKLREFLEAHKVPYSVHSHPEAFTAQEIAALQHIKGRQLAKVVIRFGFRAEDWEVLADALRRHGACCDVVNGIRYALCCRRSA